MKTAGKSGGSSEARRGYRRGRHAESNGGDEQVCDTRRNYVILSGERKEDEGELASLGKGESKEHPFACFQFEEAPEREKNNELEGEETDHDQRDRARSLRDQ